MPTVSYPGGNPTLLLSPSSYMPPFTRHLTLGSIHSWWSDRNPPGPTMDLHAASKPFMKFLYRRQVLDFIKRNDLKSIDSPPLSNETLQIYSDYLAFKYISPSTKTRILSALFRRLLSEEDARAMAHSPVVYQITELLHFPDTVIRRWACWIICMLSRHESLVVIVLRFEPCTCLVSLLSDEDIKVMEPAIYALSRISRFPHGARAVVAANTLDYLAELLKSPNATVRRWTCWTVGNLTRHDSTAKAVLALNLCVQLVALLRC
ncbi:armadillo-type protein [Mycena epipterygia]|nr:armadillo-type protein [Mycena epipterygia]